MTRAFAQSIIGVAALLVACQAPSALTSVPTGPRPALEAGKAVLTFSIAWPRSTQVIPLSAQAIRVRVLKGTAVVGELTQTRSAQSQTAQGSLLLEADSGLTFRAEAFEVRTITPSDLPIATAEQTTVTLVANQRQALALTLVPTTPPVITGISPTNGGPGVAVTLTGRFGTRGPYSAFLGSFTAQVDPYDATQLVAIVPDFATSGSWMARANGVMSEATGSFQVLRRLDVVPSEATASEGDRLTFVVPTGLDTEGATLSHPTLTQWALVDPETQATTSVGSVDDHGAFRALAAGRAELHVYSGSLMATASVRVQSRDER